MPGITGRPSEVRGVGRRPKSTDSHAAAQSHGEDADSGPSSETAQASFETAEDFRCRQTRAVEIAYRISTSLAE